MYCISRIKQLKCGYFGIQAVSIAPCPCCASGNKPWLGAMETVYIPHNHTLTVQYIFVKSVHLRLWKKKTPCMMQLVYCCIIIIIFISIHIFISCYVYPDSSCNSENVIINKTTLLKDTCCLFTFYAFIDRQMTPAYTWFASTTRMRCLSHLTSCSCSESSLQIKSG